jgi:ribonuclease D
LTANSKLRESDRSVALISADLPAEHILPFYEEDAPKTFVSAALKYKAVAWDIETSGLDWRSERIGLCQVSIEGHGLAIVKIKKNKRPSNLAAILEDKSVQKVFHHAMFDLRFMCYHWDVAAENIACTKIASKLRSPEKTQGHSLAALVHQYFGVTLDKSSRKSDWLTWGLSPEQLNYAGNDVKFLPQLLDILLNELEKKNRRDLALRCFAHIPTQVQLEIQGFKDVYAY